MIKLELILKAILGLQIGLFLLPTAFTLPTLFLVRRVAVTPRVVARKQRLHEDSSIFFLLFRLEDLTGTLLFDVFRASFAV
jgi:hypothetical protein